MYLDAQNRPSNGQSLAGLTGQTQVSTDSIDLLASIDNPGRTNIPLRAVSKLTATLTGATSIQAQLISSASSNLSSPTVLASGPTVAVANALAGTTLLDTPLPDVSQQYLGFQYVIVGGPSAGAVVTSAIVAGSDRNSLTIPMNLG